MIRPDLSLPIPESIEAAHFIGIGGSGMSGLARMFLERGIRVSGSDRADSQALRELAALGARVHVGHDAANLGDADTVIHTGAIWPENPEFVTAKERGMPVIHRSFAVTNSGFSGQIAPVWITVSASPRFAASCPTCTRAPRAASSRSAWLSAPACTSGTMPRTSATPTP